MDTTPEEWPTIKVSVRDLWEARARVVHSPEAKIKLCHLAGAPWSDKDPDAQLHDLQIEVLSRPEREKIVHGASRLGKSVLGGCETLCESMLPGSKTAIVAGRFDHVAHEFQYVYAGLRKLFRTAPQAFMRLVFKHSQNYHEYDAAPIWGSRVRGYSTKEDEGAALLGQEFSRVCLGEGSHISKDILEKKVMRAIDGALMTRRDGLMIETGYLSIYTTPKGYEGCSASEWERIMEQTKRQPEKFHYGNVPFPQTVWIREANILENPAYDRSIYDARKKTLSKAAFEEQYDGKMTFASGRIYAEFVEHTHRVPMPPNEKIRQMRLGVGIDTGAHFGMVLCGIDPQGVVWLLAEVYTQKVTINDSCDEVKDELLRVLGPVFATKEWDVIKETIDRWIVDPASQHKMELNDLLDICVEVPDRDEGKFELLPTIEQVRNLFGANQLFMADTLDWTYDQLRKYVWKQIKAVGAKNAPIVKEPKKDYDHLMDAMRFVVVPLWQMGPPDIDEIPVLTMAEAWEIARKERIHGPLKKILEKAESMGGRWV
jgi:hypothetical protein